MDNNGIDPLFNYVREYYVHEYHFGVLHDLHGHGVLHDHEPHDHGVVDHECYYHDAYDHGVVDHEAYDHGVVVHRLL